MKHVHLKKKEISDIYILKLSQKYQHSIKQKSNWSINFGAIKSQTNIQTNRH